MPRVAQCTLGNGRSSDNLPQRGCIKRMVGRLMPQSLAQTYMHIVFSTKDRRPLLADAAIRDEMHHYLVGI